MAEKQYIEREAAVEILKEKSLKMFNAYYKGYVNAIRDLIDIPSADVKPVVHAEWICHEPEIGLYYSCSKCGHNALQGMYKFCPNCGARMNGVANG